MALVEILLSTLTLAAFYLFFSAYRVRTFLWLDPASKSLQFDDEKIRKRGLASAGFHVLEVSALAAACYLLSVVLFVFGLRTAIMWILSPCAALLTVLVLAPFLVRRVGRETQVAREEEVAREEQVERETQLGRGMSILLAVAEPLRRLLVGRSRRTEERTGVAAGAPVRAEPNRGKEVLKLLLKLSERKISEVMVPRIEMVCADVSSTVSEVADLVKETSYTRIPVFSGTIDSITGYVTAKDVVIRMHQGGGAEAVGSIARTPVFVAGDATIKHALEQMQKARVTLAIVTGPSGKPVGRRVAVGSEAGRAGFAPGPTMGLVTSEDILEEVVGEFCEDYEPEVPAYQVIDDKTAIVKANVALGDLREIFGVAPSGDLKQTLGQYVRTQLSAEPLKGERVSDEVFTYSVAETTGKRIWSLRVEKRN